MPLGYGYGDTLTAMNLTATLNELKAERDRLDRAIAALSALDSQPSLTAPAAKANGGKRKMSAAGRARIAAAARARWAKVKAGKKGTVK